MVGGTGGVVSVGGVAGGGVTFAGGVWSVQVGISFMCCSRAGGSQFGWCPSVHFQAGWFPLHQVPSAFRFGHLLWSRPQLPGQLLWRWYFRLFARPFGCLAVGSLRSLRPCQVASLWSVYHVLGYQPFGPPLLPNLPVPFGPPLPLGLP